MAKSKNPPTPKDPQGSKDKKSVRRFAPPIPTVPQQYQYPQSLPQYQSVDEINAIYNMFLQNYERTRMEGQRAANLKGVDQYINRGFRDPIEQPVAPQFRFPTTLSRGAPPPQGPMLSPPPRQQMPPSQKPGGVFGPQPPINTSRPPQSLPKPPIYKSPPTGGVFGPQPPIDLSDKLPPRVSGFQPAGPDKLPPHVKEFKLGPKKPTLDSFIPRYLRDSRKA